MKTLPNVGDQGYLRQFTGSYYVDICKHPVTVIEVTSRAIKVQDAKLVFPVFKYNDRMDPYYKQFDGRRVCFYDTIAESIEPDPQGRVQTLTWHPKREKWGTPKDSYPQFLILGEGYQHQPYLD